LFVTFLNDEEGKEVKNIRDFNNFNFEYNEARKEINFEYKQLKILKKNVYK
jgi:hypothetical protein